MRISREIDQCNDQEQFFLGITPTYIVSMGVNDDDVRPGQQMVNYHGRKVE